MATSMAGPFDIWLTERLKSASADIDTDVFVSYIIGILETESTDEEREESITELLASVVDSSLVADLYTSIVKEWDSENQSKKAAIVKEDIGDKLSAILGKQTLATVQEKKLTKEEADRKAAILAQYGQVSDGDESDSDERSDVDDSPALGATGVNPAKLESTNPLLIRNVNKEEVQRAEREKREKAKEEQEKKKEKDKQDRLAQKQKQQERKESEKKRTSKGEKKR
ncbi:unnamed protein product [Lymnaea stagnalis]|uniref:Coiled-coil domain-containing protein 43 n=1 Tax=Lymnaea stagnalis TaxID=6523 RepID=A0AAV2I2R8_LYMST